ncbi:hypothetical protein B7486_69285, partial [cyanobacterium TDX16]
MRAFNKSHLGQGRAIVAREAPGMGGSQMRNPSWLAAAGLAMVTAGCVEQSGYPTTYGYGAPAYGYS